MKPPEKKGKVTVYSKGERGNTVALGWVPPELLLKYASKKPFYRRPPKSAK